MRKLLPLLLGTVLLFTHALAQNRVITGKVTDDKGNPLPIASVTVKGTPVGTTTDNAGEFRLTLPNNARTLVISAVGFAPQEMAIGSQTSFAISMKLDSKNMDEVIVTGYTREKKSQFTGAATVLSSKVVETVPVGSFDQALQGRAPGVQVNSGSGQPGSNAQVWIRGVQSISSAFAQPLYVVDGIPLSQTAFQSLNPNDFESITVLKDASAAALYGSRGGTGVIVITTKKGKQGTTNIQYRTQLGFTQRPNSTNFDMMNSREILEYEERIRVTGTPGWTYSKLNPTYATLPATSPANNPFAPSQARYDFILDSMRNINTDIYGLFFRQGFSQQHELNLSGGTEKTRFYLSGSYFDQEGTDLRAYLKRYTARFNIDHTADKLTVQFNSTIGYSKIDQSEGEWYGNSTRNTFQMSWRAKPYENPYRSDGKLNFGASTGNAPRVIANAVEGIQNSTWTQNQIKINGGLTIAYRLHPNLTLKNTFGVDVNDDRFQRWIRPDSYIGSLQTPAGRGYNIEAYRIIGQLVNTSNITYAKKFGLHDVEVGGFFEAIRHYQKILGFTLFNLDPRLPLTGQGAAQLPVSGATYPQTSSSAKSSYGIRSYFGMARYTFASKYTFNAALRRDGTSLLRNPANREITTWSLGATWNAIAEDFIGNRINWLTDLKFRASYGSVPSFGSIPFNTYNIQTIATINNFQGPQIPSFAPTSYSGSIIAGLAPTSFGNPNLRPETVEKINVGFDLSAWNRLRISMDFYKSLTKDLFASQSFSFENGFGVYNQVLNVGSMSNRGVEIMAAVDIIRNKNMDLIFTLNHAINKNRIEDLGQVSEYPSGTFLIKEGLPYGSHFTVNYLGADPQTGRPRYETIDGKVTTDLGQAGRFAKYGTFMPVHTGGFNTEFRWKNFSIAAFFSYQFDVVRSNNIESWVTRGISGYAAAVNQRRSVLTEQWQKPGDEKWIQSALYDRDFTSADLQDAKFLRFRNLNVAYNIPQINIGGTKLVKSARFYVQFQNLAIWSPWKGPDPEDNNNISLNEYPNPKMVVAGIDINF